MAIKRAKDRTPQNEVLGCTDNNSIISDILIMEIIPISFDGVDDYTRAAWSDNMNTYTVSLWVRSNVESQELYRSSDNQSYGFQLDCNRINIVFTQN